MRIMKHTYMHKNCKIPGTAEAVWLLRFWPDQYFSSKNNILQKTNNKQKLWCNFGFVRLIILSYYILKSISRGARLSIGCPYTFNLLLCSQGILLCKKLSNKQSGSVIFRPARFITLYYNQVLLL